MENGKIDITSEAIFQSNSSKNNGGGIYLGGGNMTVSGTISVNGNISEEGSGGGIYLGGGEFLVNESGIVNIGDEIKNTSSLGAGGGLYCKGKFDVKGQAIIKNNEAMNGGGVCVSNGNVSLSNTKVSTIENNIASQKGGGLFVENNGDSYNESSFNGGIFIKNRAAVGGAVCAEGKITLTLSATMEENEAKLGGGLYIAKGVNMTFNDGLIRANKATTTKDANYFSNTAFQKNGNIDASGNVTIEGVGGGIYMANNTTLSFPDDAKNLVIYNNSATHAGADICANGNSTTINLPNVKNLNLTGFHVPGNDLYWVEDYFTGEQNTISKIPGIRYEDALKNTTFNISSVIIDFQSNKTKTISDYCCLDLGYDMVILKLIVSGLSNGDDAAIILSYPTTINSNTVYTQYRKINYVGTGSVLTKKVGLPSGDWKVEPTGWSFDYKDPQITGTASTTSGLMNVKRGNTNNDITINFTKKEAGNTDSNDKSYLVRKSQSRKVNRMIP